jgi:hypothetical protein
MKFVIAAVIIIGLSLGAYQLYQYWGTYNKPDTPAAQPTPPEISGDQLPGLPASLEPALQNAEQHGATTLRDFLRANANALQDPRRAWIELDYVVLVGASNPAEARLVFSKVKARLDPSSPVYNRMKQLEKTYGQ